MVNAVYVWGLARALGGTVILRIEDHDRQRCRPEYEREILNDLDWLGLEPDLGLPAGYRSGPCGFRQSDRGAVYRNELERLRSRELVFACDCSRKALLAGAPPARHAEIRYPGRCRSRRLKPARGRGLRVIMEPGAERFEDLLLGPQAQDPSRQCGDMPVRDRLGNWTYQFAVTVDDWKQGVTLVIRGQDLLASTGRQIRLGRLLGRNQPPEYLHHPLVLKDDGEKLSKAGGDTGIRELRAAGAPPGEVLGRALSLGGLGGARSVEATALADLVGERLLGGSW